MPTGYRAAEDNVVSRKTEEYDLVSAAIPEGPSLGERGERWVGGCVVRAQVLGSSRGSGLLLPPLQMRPEPGDGQVRMVVTRRVPRSIDRQLPQLGWRPAAPRLCTC